MWQQPVAPRLSISSRGGLATPYAPPAAGSPAYVGLEQRVAALELEMQQMRHLLTQTGAGVSGASGADALVPKAAPGDDEDDSDIDEDSPLVDGWKEEIIEELDNMQYQMSQSAWDASLFIGHNLMTLRGNVLLTIGLFLNIVLQVGIVVILFKDDSFFQGVSDPVYYFFWWVGLPSRTPSDEDMVSKAHFWRTHYGHSVSNADPLTGISLVSRVCDADDSLYLSTSQADKKATLDKYLGSSGRLLSLYVIILFAVTICAELKDIAFFTAGLFGIPAGERTIVKLVDGKPQILALTRKRFIGGCVIAVLRIFIAFSLYVVGSLWLVNTIDVETLLLNSVALAFVLDTDELVYSVFSSHRVDNLIEQMEPIPCSKKLCFQLFMRPTKYAVVGVIAVLMAMFELTAVVDVQRQVRYQMCNGRQNFVFGMNPIGSMVFAQVSNGTDQISDDDKALSDASENVIDLLIRKPVGKDASPEWGQPSAVQVWLNQVRLAESKSVTEFAKEGVCEDSPRNLSRIAYLSTGNASFFKGNRSGKGDSIPAVNVTCEDVLEYCDKGRSFGVRYVCPQTCGCASPNSGLILREAYHGCPVSCSSSDEYREALNKLECKDMSHEDLKKDAAWKRIFYSWKQLVDDFTFNNWSTRYFTDKNLTKLNCSRFLRVLARQYPAVFGFDGEQKKRSRALNACRDGLIGFCPETCWCTDTKEQDEWMRYQPALAQETFTQFCPTSCKPKATEHSPLDYPENFTAEL